MVRSLARSTANKLRQALENIELAEHIKHLPWASGSGMAIDSDNGPGFVFCIRVGDWPQPQHRRRGCAS